VNTNLLAACGSFAAAPFLAMATLLLWYFVRRALSRRQVRRGRPAGFCPSSSALGVIFLIAQTFYRPEFSHVIEAPLREEVDEDDEGDPESPERQFNRQLKRIRRGEQVGDLVTRL
jgi:hypothetical protein